MGPFGDVRAGEPPFWICDTCAVEHAERIPVCRICADDRQWVPAGGQVWTSLAELAAAGRRIEPVELEPDLLGLDCPGVGIGQRAKIIRTPKGLLLWDPPGFLDHEGLAKVREFGEVVAVAASHPHMFGVQVAWSRALGGVPVWVAERDREWVARADPAIRTWSDEVEVLPGVTLSQPGGHFPGAAVAHWAAGAGGRGVLLAGDTIMANPDGRSVGFMRSFPNRIPLSGAVVERIAGHVERYAFDRLYSNFEATIDGDARSAVRFSADRHIGWVRGDFDHLT